MLVWGRLEGCGLLSIHLQGSWVGGICLGSLGSLYFMAFYTPAPKTHPMSPHTLMILVHTTHPNPFTFLPSPRKTTPSLSHSTPSHPRLVRTPYHPPTHPPSLIRPPTRLSAENSLTLSFGCYLLFNPYPPRSPPSHTFCSTNVVPLLYLLYHSLLLGLAAPRNSRWL